MTTVPVWRRLLIVSLGIAAMILVLGRVAELIFIGTTDSSARERAIRTVQTQAADLATELARVTVGLSERAEVKSAMGGDPSAVRRLFEILESASGIDLNTNFSITVFDQGGTPIAWSGRPSEWDADLLRAGTMRFAEGSSAGLRLIHVEPVADLSYENSSRATERLGSIVSEGVFSPTVPDLESGDEFVIDTTVGRVTVRPVEDGITPKVDSVAVIDLDGSPAIEAVISSEEIVETRLRWRTRVVAFSLFSFAISTFLAGGLMLGRWGRSRDVQTVALLVFTITAGRALLWVAITPNLADLSLLSPDVYSSVRWPWVIRMPFDLFLTVMLVTFLIVLFGDSENRKRLAGRTGIRSGPYGLIGMVIWYTASIPLVVFLLVFHQLVLRDTVDGSTVDLLHTALHPFDSARIALLLALVLMSASVVWCIGLILGSGASRCRIEFRKRLTWVVCVLGTLPPGLVIARGWAPVWSTVLTMTLALTLALCWRPAVRWFRHSDPLARLVAVLCATLLPALPLYFALVTLTDGAKRQLLESDYAVQTVEHPQDLQEQLALTLDQIDRIPDLGSSADPEDGSAIGNLDANRAFRIWEQTALSTSRLTSAVELYGSDGDLDSRFGLNIPEYGVTVSRWTGSGCEWEIFGEATPERRMLHAERGLCVPGLGEPLSYVGAIVVHVAQVDYESLPFISSQSPYVRFFEGGSGSQAPTAPGHEIELAIYGWGLQPTFVSDRTGWAIDEELFQRIYTSRESFWTRLSKNSIPYDVLITNDRAGIYALGYPIHTWFDHILHLSEIAVLVITAFGLMIAVVVVIGSITPGLRRKRVTREVRVRFALRLQLWFLGVATAPVLVVAVLIQGYFSERLRADVEAEAVRAAVVAQNVIEESYALRSIDEEGIESLTDDALVGISQVVGQNLNIFDGSRLLATSERDLYASGLLPTRTPAVVYRTVNLSQLPSFVGEDTIGSLRYQLAAVPIESGGEGLILTVPFNSRQQEIEGQIDELNRRIWSYTLFFVAIVGFLGWAVARRIADPVRRLTRATSRVARGEFYSPISTRRAEVLEERVVSRTADELEILESDFNEMAVRLDAQRRELQRTHRLEAWTEMARQVAHEIKNPLTPVQLSAEHLLKVHADRGSPLSPVLQGCVESILKQVRILRQIASEFSSYSSAPSVDLAPVALDSLLEETIDPYRLGLEGRVIVFVDVESDLPILQLDRVLIQRALINILENALYSMPDGGSLSIAVIKCPSELQLSVVDTGVGLDADVLARVFEPYFSTKVSGTGLGMAIAKRNVELNGGTITVSSEPGLGTRVKITLPICLGSKS